MVLVDSCIWITAAKAHGDLQVKLALEALLHENEAAFCGPVKLEVLGGARKERRRALSFFFEAVPYIPMQDKDWQLAVELGWLLRERGVNAPWNDVLIASLARTHDCRVYSIDNHFTLFRDHCGLSLYEPGYGGGFQPDDIS
jgi:predicted nucleic acid-binding protein